MISKKPGLKEIARRCGTTPSTVSRVLAKVNEGFSVRPELRELIERTAAEIGYRPNLAAMSLSRRQTGLVAMLGLLEPWGLRRAEVLADAVIAAEEELLRVGYHLVVLGPETTRQSGQLPWRTDGMLVINPDTVPCLQDAIASFPLRVFINGPGSGGPSIQVDDAAGVDLAISHFASLGHKRVAYRNAAGSWTHQAISDRRSALPVACAKHGVELVLGADDRSEDAVGFLRKTVVMGRATAVLSFDVYTAMPLLRAAAELGMAVPRGFSLATFNEQEICSHTNPPLTTLSLPTREMGVRAAQALVCLMAGDPVPPELITPIPPRLICRESTAIR